MGPSNNIFLFPQGPMAVNFGFTIVDTEISYSWDAWNLVE